MQRASDPSAASISVSIGAVSSGNGASSGGSASTICGAGYCCCCWRHDGVTWTKVHVRTPEQPLGLKLRLIDGVTSP